MARLEPDAAAYAAVKDRSAGVELEAHRRAQGVLDQANSQARHLRQQMEQWMTRVGREYDALRTEVEATISHAADQLDKALEILKQCAGKRKQTIYSNVAMPTGSQYAAAMPSVPVNVELGGVTVFVMDLEKLEKF